MCEACGYPHNEKGAREMWRKVRKEDGFKGRMHWTRRLTWDRGMVAKYRYRTHGWDFYDYGSMIHMFLGLEDRE